ncbi:MAG: amidohydrolase family protein, partial [Candidatus Nezhaarchaeota archaeon]|nr:amidohydrolase family protein [Candidatus Nezhaarchaeota archaeon]
LGRDLGKVEPGCKADLVVFDFSRPHLTPLYDEVSHLVYAARSRDVRYVLVDGEVVVEDGVYKKLKEEEVTSKAIKERDRLVSKLSEKELV